MENSSELRGRDGCCTRSKLPRQSLLQVDAPSFRRAVQMADTVLAESDERFRGLAFFTIPDVSRIIMGGLSTADLCSTRATCKEMLSLADSLPLRTLVIRDSYTSCKAAASGSSSRGGGGTFPTEAVPHSTVAASVLQRLRLSSGMPLVIRSQLDNGTPEQQQDLMSMLLAAARFTAGDSGLPMRTKQLEMQLSMLGSQMGSSVNKTFPFLERLILTHCGAPLDDEDVFDMAEELLTLMGTGTEGKRGGRCPAPMTVPLPLLTFVEFATPLPDSGYLLIATMMRHKPLRELRVAVCEEQPTDTQLGALASLTQLSALSISCAPGVIAADLLPAYYRLTGLTRLELLAAPRPSGYANSIFGHSTKHETLMTPSFYKLASLQELHLRGALSLCVAGLSELTALTNLIVDDMFVPGPGIVGYGRLANGRWPLSPRLRRLEPGSRCFPSLSQLEPPSSLTEVVVQSFDAELLHGMEATHSDVELSAAALSLRGTCQFLAGRMQMVATPGAATVHYHTWGSQDLWRRAGAGAGDAPSHHSAWLGSMGGLGLRELRLHGFVLNAPDLQCLADSLATLQSLELDRCTFNPAALESLTGLTSLSKLELNIREEGWSVRQWGRWVPAPGPAAIVGLCKAAQARGGSLAVVLKAADRSKSAALLQEVRTMVRADLVVEGLSAELVG